ncbi:epididymal secretory protein E1-like protein, partial [Leptotrombidium deliense]
MCVTYRHKLNNLTIKSVDNDHGIVHFNYTLVSKSQQSIAEVFNRLSLNLGGSVEGVRAFGCLNDTEPCVVKRGSISRLEVEFIAPFTARWVRADARARVDGFFSTYYMPWTGMHRNACDGHGLQCPIVQNRRYKYIYEAP